MNDPMEPLRRLREQLAAVVAPLGLQIVGDVAFIPGGNGIGSHMQAIFEIDAEMAGKDAEERAIEEEAQKFRAELAAMEREQKAQDAVERLKRMAGSGGSFLEPFTSEPATDVEPEPEVVDEPAPGENPVTLETLTPEDISERLRRMVEKGGEE